ncbi:NADP oxidoreductase coenzyme F420-dependent [Leptospira inadai serovar Lyme str. 10]|uniref:NADP oxidoreductase coenzyme F420-dependent n=2 Tax=Leptospira inadai serovar Lyme TaxID=293084 RepID=V6HW95_9LEPT|nr:NAD(P)-dependent oxidoreductase [Leptospira inadai]EQA37199.1 NADP oxidoreductase coenzyme F420-dependent [Leptospira inadai serovar Lyme str. 10]PNV76535.1 3-hydroxyisobutyrate dehydrogenase [Leptospira inadai serovar Lyme]
MSTPEIAIIGTGIMGRGMAYNLSTKGYKLRLYARNPDKIRDLESDTVSIHDNPSAAADRATLVVLCLTEDSVVEETIFSLGLLESKCKYVLDTGTTSPELTVRIGRAFSERGITFFDSPMTGSKNASRDGQILFMIGAKDPEEISEISFFFDTCGKNVVYCGTIGDGQKAKIALNMVQAGIFQVYMEGFLLAKKQGISPEILKDILLQSAAKSGIAEFKFPLVFAGNYETHFSLKNMRKDVNHALALAKQAGIILPLCSSLGAIYDEGIREGLAEKDYCSLNEITAKIVAKPSS